MEKKSSGSKVIIFLGAFVAVFVVMSGLAVWSLGQLNFSIPFLENAEKLKKDDLEKGKEIWEKHLEVSGQKDKSLPGNLIMKGVLNMFPKKKPTDKISAVIQSHPGITGFVEYYYKAPGKIYSSVKMSLPQTRFDPATTVIVEKYFNGEIGWEKKTSFAKGFQNNRTETTRQLSEEEIKFLNDEIFIRIFSGYTSFKYNGTTTIEGDQNLIIQAIKSTGETDIIYFDQNTYLVSKIEFAPKAGVPSNEFAKEMYFSGYKSLNGVQVPYFLSSAGDKAYMRMVFTEIHFDTEIDDKTFDFK